MDNVGQAADTVSDHIVQSSRDLGALRRMVTHLEDLNNLARSYQDNYPEGGARAWAGMVREVEESRTTIAALREQVAQDREALACGRGEAEKMLHRSGGADVTADLAWPNTPADEIIARQQVALVAALRDRVEAREYLRERGNDVLQLPGELHESNTVQQALSEQVARQTVEIKRLSALCESELVLRADKEAMHQTMVNDGRRQDEVIRNLRSELASVRHDLRLKEVQSNERLASAEHWKKKVQEIRDVQVQPELQRLSAELKESESKRQDLMKLKAVLDDQDVRDREAAEVVKEARDLKAQRDKWQSAFGDIALLHDKLITEAEEIRDRLVKAVRDSVRGDEGLRGAVDFLNWSRENFLVVGDLAGWVEAWQSRAPFSSTVNVIGTGPAQASSPVVPLPAIADVDEVEKEVTLWRERIDEVLAKLRDRGVRDRHLLAALVPGARNGGEETKGSEAQTSFISPRSKPQFLIHNPPGHEADLDHEDPNPSISEDEGLASGAISTLVDQARKRPSVASTPKSKRSCVGSPRPAAKTPRSAPAGAVRSRILPPSIVSAYEAIVVAKPWERYQHLPSIFPEERANDATRLVDEALKMFWKKRWREVFERLFYLKLDSANDKYGSLDQITGILGMVLASLKVAEEDSAGQQHLSPIAYFCSPRHQWPMLFKAPICLKTMFFAHGGGDQGERVVLDYLAEAKEWFPKVPALARQGDKLLEWLCDPVSTFKYYTQRGSLKSKPQDDLAKYQVQTISDLKVVCTQAISLVESGSVVPGQPYDFVDLVYTGLRDPSPQWGAVESRAQGRLVRVDGGPVELREAYEERQSSTDSAMTL
ncbi:hypothetical protein AC1031_017066 [Aphanomyces cochlioides]|nr:hypothetical protein AC1031_017066 [Aphanomyces cochlioides]